MKASPRDDAIGRGLRMSADGDGKVEMGVFPQSHAWANVVMMTFFPQAQWEEPQTYVTNVSPAPAEI